MDEKELKLKELLKEIGKIVITYSGGIDSSYLLKVALDTLGSENVLAAVVNSELFPDYEFDMAIDLANEMGARVIGLEMEELSDPRIAANTPKIWYYGGTSKNKNIQYQSINQSFRMVGSINEKHGNEIIAFKVGEKVDLEYLNSFAEEKNRVDIKKRFKPSKYTLEEAKIKFPQWYEKTILNGEKYKSKWHIKRDLYEWWKTKIDLIEGGHRYFYLMCLAIYAYKCDVSKKELKIDMWKIFTELKTKKHFNEFTKFDVISALESYDKGLANFTIKDIEYLTNVRIDRNRRNGRKQNEHLKLARFAQKLNYPNDEWRQGNGRPSKEKEVQEWQKLHPNGTKADCHKDTKISRQTIHKFWQN